jgi:hypothetical protein
MLTIGTMPRTLGVFHELFASADFLWNQCDGPLGASGNVLIRAADPAADHALIINWPAPPGGSRRAGGWKRYLYKLARRPTTALRVRSGYRWVGRDPETTTALMYEPPPLVSDWLYDFTKAHCARVYGPDPRATHQTVLPAMWTFDDDLHSLRAFPPPEKPVPLVGINAGRPVGKMLIPGHSQRLDFFRLIRDAGLPCELFGRGLRAELGGLGSVASKANVLRPARMALVIENYAEGDQYVTEKLWDALLCWCLPIYYGSRAIDRLIPSGSFIRLPDLKAAGLETLRAALADPHAWEDRLPAIAEARRRAMGELRLVEWAKREVFGMAFKAAETGPPATLVRPHSVPMGSPLPPQESLR